MARPTCNPRRMRPATSDVPSLPVIKVAKIILFTRFRAEQAYSCFFPRSV